MRFGCRTAAQESGMFWRSKSTRRATFASTFKTVARKGFWGAGWNFDPLLGHPAAGFELAGIPILASQLGGALPGYGPVQPSQNPSARNGGPGSGLTSRLARSGGPEKGPETGAEAGPERARNDHFGEGNSGTEDAYTAQPSRRDGVPEDMATMVLDSPALVAGSALRSNPASEPGLNSRGEVDPASDAAVMLRVAAGDEAGFNYLVAKYHRPMIHFLYRMVHNQSVAEELAQEVFLRVYRARDSYRAEARFTTWLYRIATNLAVNHARDTRHERAAQTVYLDAPDEETGTTPDLADDEPSVEQRLLRDERMAAIRSHVMALPERQRMAVLMHKYQGMDYRQIGEVLKLSESATKSLLFRAYQTLRDKLKEFV
jgi:RNA polymerase sigma-70 factor, ECF subfamily